MTDSGSGRNSRKAALARTIQAIAVLSPANYYLTPLSPPREPLGDRRLARPR